MYTTILTVHIISMIASMVVMSGAVIVAILGKKFAVDMASFGMIATFFGSASGIAMLLDAPLSIQCAGLTAYLVAVAAIYHVGFGFGRIEKARFVRQS